MHERELIQAVRTGDREAFGALMDLHHGMVYGICLRMTGNALEAETLAQDAFIEAYLKLDQLRDPGKFGPWLRQIALNICRMWYRQHKGDLLKSVEELPEIAQEPDDDPTQIARMGSALSELSTNHRLVLALHYFEGMPYEKIGEFLDVPVGTVMSRLYRARQALKEASNGQSEDKEASMSADEQFKEEVQAEISVLLQMSDTQPGAKQRLAVVLGRSPERLVDLIRQETGETMLDQLALLVPRLGPDATGILLETCFSSDEVAAARARTVLSGLVARDKVFRAGGWEGDSTASAATYHMLDMLIRLPVEPADKAELLTDLMTTATSSTTTLLLTNLLMCYPQEAFPILMQRFQPQGDDGLSPSSVLLALCRAGTLFCGELVTFLTSGDAHERALGLAGVEAVARCLNKPSLDDASPERFANEVRMRHPWAPLRAEDLDADVLERMTAATASLLKHDQTHVRNAALRTLGHLHAERRLDDIVLCAAHQDQSTRIEAIKALAEIGGSEVADTLIRAAGNGDAPEQQAAIEAIGRCRIEEAEPLLLELTSSSSAPIQQAAVTALGEIGSKRAVEMVQEMLRTGPKRLKRVAARSLQRLSSLGKPRSP